MANTNLACFSKKIEWPKKGLAPFLRKFEFFGKSRQEICFATHIVGRASKVFFATQASLQLPKSYDELKLVSLQFHRQKLGVKLEGCKNAFKKLYRVLFLFKGAINARIC